MGFVKKSDLKTNKDGKTYTIIDPYYVVKDSKNFTGIYLDEILITSKPKWSQAIKLTKLLSKTYQEAYRKGENSMRDEDYWRHCF